MENVDTSFSLINFHAFQYFLILCVVFNIDSESLMLSVKLSKYTFHISMQENAVVEAGSSDDNSTSKPTNDGGIPEYPNKSVNRQIAVVSVLAAVGLFLSGRLEFGVSLKDLSAAALPYEEVSLFYYWFLFLPEYLIFMH